MAGKFYSLPETGYVRLNQILGQEEVTEEQAAQNRRTAATLSEAERKKERSPKSPRPSIPPLIPCCKSTWWDGVKSGRFPQPVKTLGPRITAWYVEDIRALLKQDAV